MDEVHHYEQDSIQLALNISKHRSSIAEIVAKDRKEVLVYDNKDGSLKIYGVERDIRKYIKDLYERINDIKVNAEHIEFQNIGKSAQQFYPWNRLWPYLSINFR